MRLLYITPYVEGVGGVPRVLSVKTNYLINKWNYDISILATNSGTVDTFYDFNKKIHFYSEKAGGKNLVYIYYYLYYCVEWEKLPNGKWKPKKTFKKENGKYQFDDPRYIAISQKKMAAVKIMCLNCKGFYTLLEPCIHHLPDGYKNYKLKQEYKKSK